MSLHKKIEKFKEQWDRYFETVEKPASCIFCEGDRIYWNGQRQRGASVLIADTVIYFPDILCKRVKCANHECRKSWTLRPPGLMPRRHYQLCVVAHATMKFVSEPRETLTSAAEAHCCSRRTLGRWLHWIAGIAEPAELLRRLLHVCKEAALQTFVRVREIFEKAPNRRAFRRTVNNFCFVDALGMSYGYHPPGFTAMIEAALAHRDRISTYRNPSIPELAR